MPLVWQMVHLPFPIQQPPPTLARASRPLQSQQARLHGSKSLTMIVTSLLWFTSAEVPGTPLDTFTAMVRKLRLTIQFRFITMSLSRTVLLQMCQQVIRTLWKVVMSLSGQIPFPGLQLRIMGLTLQVNSCRSKSLVLHIPLNQLVVLLMDLS